MDSSSHREHGLGNFLKLSRILVQPLSDISFVFYLHIDDGYILLVIYVDDMVITGDDFEGVAKFKQFSH
jgi:hypothetical protein